MHKPKSISKSAAVLLASLSLVNMLWLYGLGVCAFSKVHIFPTKITVIFAFAVFVWACVLITASSVTCSDKLKRLACSQAFAFHLIIAIGTTIYKSTPSSSSFNLQFFKTIKMYFNRGWSGDLLYNFYGNILLFVPISFFLLCMLKKCKLRKLSLFVLVIVTSPLIESIQYFTKRGFFDVDDIFLNTFGLLAGALLYKLLAVIIRKAKLSERLSVFV